MHKSQFDVFGQRTFISVLFLFASKIYLKDADFVDKQFEVFIVVASNSGRLNPATK